MKQLPDDDGYFDFTCSVALSLLRGEEYDLGDLGGYLIQAEQGGEYVMMGDRPCHQVRFMDAFTAAWWCCTRGSRWRCLDRFGRIIPGVRLIEAPR